MERRKFLKLTSFSAAATGAGATFSFGQGTLTPEQLYAKFIPTDKGLSKDWLKDIKIRGNAQDKSISAKSKGANLDVIGMTVGGIGCGTVYLSGDGRLWIWDIFNQHHQGVVKNNRAKAPEYLKNIQNRNLREDEGANFLLPPTASQHTNGVVQRFSLKLNGQSHSMDQKGWSDVRFTGRWPVGHVEFRDSKMPIEVDLNAYSPFIPLNLKESSLPVSVMEYTLRNTSDKEQSLRFSGELNNVLGQYSGLDALRNTKVIKKAEWSGFVHGLQAKKPKPGDKSRPDQVLFDFENGYQGWKVTGTAFGKKPVNIKDILPYQGDVKAQGEALVNSHASPSGANTTERDRAVGTLLSPEFTIVRSHLSFLIGGGKDAQKLAVRLLINGKSIASATGHNTNEMRADFFDLSKYQGQKARVEIIDQATGGWGNIGADQFILTDGIPEQVPFKNQLDYGSMSLGVVEETSAPEINASGEITVSCQLKPKEERIFRFVVAWHLPNLNPSHGCGKRQRHYVRRFLDAEGVIDYFSSHADNLCNSTKNWVKTWNDSSLPQWLLDRTMLTTNTLQTQNCMMFENSRFWAWEGIGCCPGTCGHVWQYSQGHARLFPEIERNLRETTDFKLAQKANGEVLFRGSNNNISAIDSQCSYILRVLRDHQLSDDPGYLARVWKPTRLALNYLIEFDKKDSRGGLDGLLDGSQHNTLDTEWYGKVHVLCSMYLASLRAGEELAKSIGDTSYSKRCSKIYQLGSKKIETLFNGEFYEQIEDPLHPKAVGVGKGCYIDQVMGQFWANQVGLGRLYNADHQKSALRALWKYNFVPDYGNFRQGFKKGRHYATRGDSGLLMCSWPKGGLRNNIKKHWQYGYFNEFMTGFEYEAAAHMIAERDPDLVDKGFAIVRSIHDRYSISKGRNPYNEIECSDHYARAGASYGVYLALCGFHFDQERQHIEFDPVVGFEKFKSSFIGSKGWGSYQQDLKKDALTLTYSVKWGELSLQTIGIGTDLKIKVATIGGKEVPFRQLNRQVTVILPQEVRLQTGDVLEIKIVA